MVFKPATKLFIHRTLSTGKRILAGVLTNGKASKLPKSYGMLMATVEEGVITMSQNRLKAVLEKVRVQSGYRGSL